MKIKLVKALKLSTKAFLAIIVLLSTAQLQQVHLLSLGSSVFNVFYTPNSHIVRVQNLIGSYIIAIIVGILCSWVKNLHIFTFIPGYLFIVGSFSVALLIYATSVFNLEHPPSAGIALGFVYASWNYFTPIVLIICIIELAIIKKVFT